MSKAREKRLGLVYIDLMDGEIQAGATGVTLTWKQISIWLYLPFSKIFGRLFLVCSES